MAHPRLRLVLAATGLTAGSLLGVAAPVHAAPVDLSTAPVTAERAIDRGSDPAAPGLPRYGKVDGFVAVPATYVYAPQGPHKGWHDFCTFSPDSWGSADFRGPCAKHDMAYEAADARVLAADTQLQMDMESNCDVAYPRFDPRRRTCYWIAATYRAVVASLTWSQLRSGL